VQPGGYTRTLRHALDEHSVAEAAQLGRVLVLPPLPERVLVIGGTTVERLYREALKPPTKPTQAKRQRRRQWTDRPGLCRWCGEPLPPPARAPRHTNCRRTYKRTLAAVIARTQPLIRVWRMYIAETLEANKAGERRRPFGTRRAKWLKKFLQRSGTADGEHVRYWYAVLDAEGWLGVDALRAIEAAILEGELPSESPAYNTALKAALRCACGELLKGRRTAVTCGKSTCRSRLFRANQRRARDAELEEGDQASSVGTDDLDTADQEQGP
jgi:hypothetical protein